VLFTEQSFASLLKPLNVCGVVATAMFGTVCKGVNKLVTSSQKHVDSLEHTIKNCFDSLKRMTAKVLGPFWKALCLVIAAKLIMSFPSSPMGHLLRLSVIVIVAKLTGLREIIDTFLHPLARTVTGSLQLHNTYTEESIGFDQIGKMLATATVVSAFKGKKDARLIDRLTNLLSKLPRAAEGWSCLTEWVVQAFDAIVNFFKKEKDDTSFSLHRKLVKTDAAADAWCAEAARLLALLHDLGPDKASHSVARRLHDWSSKGIELTCIYGPNTSAGRAIHQMRVNVANALAPRLSQIHAQSGTRQEPVMLVLKGAPGVGKTFLVPYISASVMCMAEPHLCNEPKSFWEKNTWSRPHGSPYWEGYSGQDILVRDEIFQINPEFQQAGEDEYTETIRQVNTFAYPLNMATLQSKGLYSFCSKLIIGTTNATAISSNAAKIVASQDAIYRRMHFVYDIEWVGQSRGEMSTMSIEEVNRERKRIGSFPWHLWAARPWCLKTGNHTGPAIPLKELVNLVGGVMRRNKMRFDEAEDIHTGFVSSLSAPPPVAVELPDTIDDIPIVAQQIAAARALDPDAPEFVPRAYTEESMALPVAFGVGTLTRYLFEQRRVDSFCDALDINVSSTEGDDYRYLHSMGIRYTEQGIHPDDEQRAKNIMREHIRSALKADYRERTRYVRLISGCILAYAGATLAIKLFMGIFNAFFSAKVDEQTGRAGASLAPARSENFKPPEVVLQSSFIDSKVDKNSYKIVALGDEPVSVGHCLFVVEAYAVMPHHYRHSLAAAIASGKLKSSSTLMLYNRIDATGATHEIKTDVQTFLNLPHKPLDNSDVMMVRFEIARESKPLLSRVHEDIRRNFILESDLKHFSGFPVSLHTTKLDAQNRLQRYTHVYNKSKYVAAVFIGKGSSTKMHGVVEYDKAVTEFGDCGSPLTLNNTDHHNGRGIVALHTGVDGTKGIACPITQERIETLIKQIPRMLDQHEFGVDLKKNIASFSGEAVDRVFEEHSGWSLTEAPGNFYPIGLVTPTLRAHVSPKSKLQLTAVGRAQPFGPSGLKPAHLSNFFDGVKIVKPMSIALQRYSRPLHVEHRPYLNVAINVAMKSFSADTSASYAKPLTYDEAVLGIPSIGLRSLPRGTSAGYPYKLFVKKGKTDFFTDEDEYNLDQTDKGIWLRERVSDIIESGKARKRLDHIFTDALKDELRSEEKVDAGATRLLSCAPVCYTIACRMAFGAFMAAFMRCDLRTGFLPGINPMSDWAELGNLLREKGDGVTDGDFKAMDATESRDVLWAIHDYIQDWYKRDPDWTEEWYNVRRTLFYELTDSYHIGGTGMQQDFIYQWHQSMPSGHPLTTVVNSIYCKIVLVYTYVSRCAPAGLDAHAFDLYINAVVYGDDNMSNVHKRASKIYNAATIKETAFKDFSGMIYTAGDKTAEITEHLSSLYGKLLLQRGFSEENSSLCPLNPKCFMFTNYYCANRKIQGLIERDNWETFLLELSMHDAEMWNKYAPEAFERYTTSCANFSDSKGSLRVMNTNQANWREEALRMELWY
jgi:hypothetical protein